MTAVRSSPLVRLSAFSLSIFTQRLSLLSISLALCCFSVSQLHAAPTKLGAASFETYISDDGEPARINALLEKVFNKFERIKTQKREGTGLGLPIAKEIVELHKGKMWVESEVGKGSRFIFVLTRDFRKQQEA